MKVQKRAGITGLDGFSAHGKALELFDLVAADVQALSGKYELTKLLAQQLASADSIAANIEEGYGRGSKRDYSHFLIIARGSAQETLGRCKRLAHWLDSPRTEQEADLLSEIIAILTATIRTLRAAAPQRSEGEK
jgi:four helix bundle protein